MSLNESSSIITLETRESIKETFRSEVERLPELLEELSPKERINIILKLMPYLMPTVKSVHYTEGESFVW